MSVTGSVSENAVNQAILLQPGTIFLWKDTYLVGNNPVVERIPESISWTLPHTVDPNRFEINK